jgi:hypothetical protein
LKVIHLIRNPYSQIASELRIDARNPAQSREHFRSRVDQIISNRALAAYHEQARTAIEMGWVAQMALVWRVSNELLAHDTQLKKKTIVYEQLARDPFNVVDSLFGFLGWEVSQQTRDFVASTSSVDPSQVESGNFSLQKNAEESMNRWRRELTEEIHGEALAMLNGSPLLDSWSDEELRL